MNGMISGKIPVPKGFSVKGVDMALEHVDAESDYEGQSMQDCLENYKQQSDKFVTPETIDKVVNMDMNAIAKSWKYRALR